MTYRVITSDGKKRESHGTSAAHAIEEARWLYRGLSVVSCYSGLKQDDVDFLRKVDSSSRPIVGYIDHEVPQNDPIPKDVVRNPKRPAFKDNTSPMFNESDIERESQVALNKRKNES